MPDFHPTSRQPIYPGTIQAVQHATQHPQPYGIPSGESKPIPTFREIYRQWEREREEQWAAVRAANRAAELEAWEAWRRGETDERPDRETEREPYVGRHRRHGLSRLRAAVRRRAAA